MSNPDEEGFSFTFGEDVEEKVNVVRAYRASIDVDWDRLQEKTDAMPVVTINNTESVSPESLRIVQETAQKAGVIFGLAQPDAPDSSVPLWDFSVDVVPQSDFGDETTHAGVQHGRFMISKDYLDPALRIEKSKEDIDEILGPVEGRMLGDESTISEFMLEKTVAHELYHLRQQRILFWRSKDKKSDSTRRTELKQEYLYDPSERAPRAIEIRYLREEYKALDTQSRRAQLLERYMNYLTKQEADISQKFESHVNVLEALDNLHK